ncbi:protein kinase domain-containing protein [Actinoplanes utahensis]|uniref:Protein kinase domain-containing protein n=1 Tax=Actinoplanes utahensis TaxID=1869 RepID=A0A0A6X5J0_ACTUT|nr:protein kinase [Actinoplanes utahensis]KHD75377.1 hypothetical protein MB27_23375 [Actinoplanes utahensis]GIF33713.1 hypothetical protein Aut01nite_66990 [Actinoplanes utahensis]
MTENAQPAPGTTRDTAPGTTRDAAPGTTRDTTAPGTTRDTAAPGTTRDTAAPAPGTTRDTAAPAPGTTRDGAVPGPTTTGERFVRVNLPPTLQQRYAVDRELGAGGEADVLLANDRETGEQRVVRLYRRQDLPLDDDKLKRLLLADRQHLIALLDYGRGDGYVWEILEFAREGSLEELLARTPAPWPAPQVLSVFDQLAPAITYANSLGMVHRDIKPGNVLIRSINPLDMVLADFGLTKFIAATHHIGTNSRTSAYAPPEAIGGGLSRSSDWWSLGMVLLELLVGRSPFQRTDGTWMDDRFITHELISREIDVSEVADEHWRLLLRGLLTRAPDKRWGPQQTAMWRNGGKPPVADPEPATATATGAGPTTRGSNATYVFGGRGYNDPVQLAAALRADWGEGRRLLAGRKLKTPQYLALKDWMTKHQRAEAVQALDNGVDERPERGLMQVIMALDPNVPPEFNGRRLDGEHLHALLRDAVGGQVAARQLLDQVYEDGILTICDEATGCTGYAMLDDRWHRSVDTAQARLQQENVPLQAEHVQSLRMQLLITAYEGQGHQYAEAARQAAQNPEALQQQWFRNLAGEQIVPQYQAAHHAVLMMAAPVAASQTMNQRAEAERRRIAAEQHAVAQSRAKVDQLSVPIGVVCGLLACMPVVGFLTALAAIYCGVRARRTQYQSASTWAIGLGGVGVVLQLCYLMQAIAGVSAQPPAG